MEQLIPVAVGSFLLYTAGVIGFYFGQKSIKLVGQRTEILKSSDQLTIQRVIPEPTKENPYAPQTPNQPISSMIPPPEYRHLHDQFIKEREGES